MSLPPRPPPALLDDLVELVLLRVPPDDPASLVRASLVCKLWRRLISGNRFRRRYREFHHSPPMLGFFYHKLSGAIRFLATSSFRPPRAYRSNWHAMDARHGRIVFRVSTTTEDRMLMVSNPVTGDERWLPVPDLAGHYGCATWNVAVVCAAAGCDHVDCPSGGPFTLVFLGSQVLDKITAACTYSSKTGSWGQTISVEHSEGYVAHCSVLVGNMLHFILRLSNQILEYDLDKQEISVIDPPSSSQAVWAAPITTKDDRLGIAMYEEPNLCIWSREAGLNGDAEWVQQRVFELDKLLPAGALQISPLFCGTVGNSCVIFMGTLDGLFAIDLKSGRVTRKLLEDYDICDIVPYMSFCIPSTSTPPGNRPLICPTHL
ncbi:hypothetical protein PR202_gb12028 [Eleusine coracana subsp. coracana]|uniref:F-box domain-containing protein n=1 Tax=Eleusine coracana subsp. coracana TaxID=191504 RepID=A0AAV5ELZ1_ELECO|nr:hypothetical protein PR202_gb12028 [Eleusine coracana subsp. coracana]